MDGIILINEITMMVKVFLVSFAIGYIIARLVHRTRKNR